MAGQLGGTSWRGSSDCYMTDIRIIYRTIHSYSITQHMHMYRVCDVQLVRRDEHEEQSIMCNHCHMLLGLPLYSVAYEVIPITYLALWSIAQIRDSNVNHTVP